MRPLARAPHGARACAPPPGRGGETGALTRACVYRPGFGGPAGAARAAPRGQAGNESNHGNPPEEVYSAGDVNPLSPELGQPDFPFSHSN